MKIIKLSSDFATPYQTMYITLSKAITAALYMLEDNEILRAQAVLTQAQRETEKLYTGSAAGKDENSTQETDFSDFTIAPRRKDCYNVITLHRKRSDPDAGY